MDTNFEKAFLAIVNDNEFEYHGDEEAPYSELSQEMIQEVLYALEDKDSLISKKYNATVAEQHGGEGQGDDYYYVVKIEDKFYMIPGYYESWNGSELHTDQTHEVEPYEVMVTKYRAVNGEE